jgi:hypothetical protein
VEGSGVGCLLGVHVRIFTDRSVSLLVFGTCRRGRSRRVMAVPRRRQVRTSRVWCTNRQWVSRAHIRCGRSSLCSSSAPASPTRARCRCPSCPLRIKRHGTEAVRHRRRVHAAVSG